MQLGNKNRKHDQKEKQLREMKLDFFFKCMGKHRKVKSWQDQKAIT